MNATETSRPTSTLSFFFNDTATTEIYTLSLHELFRSQCLPSAGPGRGCPPRRAVRCGWRMPTVRHRRRPGSPRSEEHTSELQSQSNLVCRLLLEKKKRD